MVGVNWWGQLGQEKEYCGGEFQIEIVLEGMDEVVVDRLESHG